MIKHGLTASSAGWATPIRAADVEVLKGFWKERIDVVRERTLPHIHEQLERVGAIEGLRLTWRRGEPNPPKLAADTDVYKWLEAVSYSLGQHRRPWLEEVASGLIGIIERAQQPDGYLNPYYTLVEPAGRWNNLRDAHELYSAGHLIEAGVAHSQATGSEALLNVGIRFADLIVKTFGHGSHQIPGYCGHPEIELALLRLFRHTGDRRYLELAKYFIDERGTEPYYFDLEAAERRQIGFSSVFQQNIGEQERRYNQTHAPIRQHTEVVGHAVRAMYLYAAAIEVAVEVGDEELSATCAHLWDGLVGRRMYVTGGVGSSKYNEGFTRDYDLPDLTSYAETCAAVGVVFWAHRMALASGQARHVDVLERALYNGALAGLSLDGESFFYENKLASAGGVERRSWFDIACCPPNIARLVASVGGYIYARASRDLVVNLGVSSRLTFDVDGTKVQLRQTTELPWGGRSKIVFESGAATPFAVHLRIPEWSDAYTVTVNAGRVDAPTSPSGYFAIERPWRAGDSITLELSVTPRSIRGNPLVESEMGRIALRRGPVVYCFEEVDQSPVGLNPRDLLLEADGNVKETEPQPNLAGATKLRLSATDSAMHEGRSIAAFAIPYHLWANRGDGSMRVWMLSAGGGVSASSFGE